MTGALAVCTTPPVTTVTGNVPAVVFFNAAATVKLVDDTYTVACGTPLMYTTLCGVKPTPVTVRANVFVPDAIVDGLSAVAGVALIVGLVVGLSDDACVWLGDTGPAPTDGAGSVGPVEHVTSCHVPVVAPAMPPPVPEYGRNVLGL